MFGLNLNFVDYSSTASGPPSLAREGNRSFHLSPIRGVRYVRTNKTVAYPVWAGAHRRGAFPATAARGVVEAIFTQRRWLGVAPIACCLELVPDLLPEFDTYALNKARRRLFAAGRSLLAFGYVRLPPGGSCHEVTEGECVLVEN